MSPEYDEKRSCKKIILKLNTGNNENKSAN